MSGLTRKRASAIAICGILVFAAIGLAFVLGVPGVSDDLADLIGISCVFLQTSWCLLWIQPIRRAAANDYERMVRILDEQCDPEEFLKTQCEIYRGACRAKKIRSIDNLPAVAVRINQAVALSFAGRHSEAIDEVNAILAIPVKKDKDFYHCMCHINLSVFLARRSEDGDLAAAREHLKKAGECIKNIGQSYSVFSGEIIRAGYIVDTVEGKNPEAALVYFSKGADSAPAARTEAGNRFMLALIHRQLGDTESERTQLEFVAQTAPKAYIGKQAAARLAGFSAQ